ncbi:hypothetical protein F5B19DRAFT_439674 [Rostrohypoxylon terebratum]|nr:hypothetical protein F5B19DRAFT_439674 [Rostrohypoxylon terebratum]
MAKFSALPPELRFRIWDFALHQEAHDRLVIAVQECNYMSPNLVPLKHHASPFLSVNYESRKKAQAFYSVKLAVYEAPKIGFEEFVDNLSQPECPKLRSDYFHDIGTDLDPKGVLYISPQWDIFVLVHDFTAIYTYILAGQMRGSLSRHHITKRVRYEVRDEISNIACIRDEEREIGSVVSDWLYTGPEEYISLRLTQIPHTIFPRDVYDFWNLHVFQRIKSYQYLYLTKVELKVFMFNVMKHGGRGSYDFRDMAVCLSDAAPGLWVLFDRGELRSQNREMPDSELKLKPFTPDAFKENAWNTIKQIENYE